MEQLFCLFGGSGGVQPTREEARLARPSKLDTDSLRSTAHLVAADGLQLFILQETTPPASRANIPSCPPRGVPPPCSMQAE